MFKKVLAALIFLSASLSFAAVEVNKATAAELDSIKGIGPSVSAKILDERKKGNFKDWNDLIDRVKGIGDGNAAKFSAAGLTVAGAAYKAAATPVAKKDDKAAVSKETKPAVKADEKKPAEAPKAAASVAKK